MSGPEISHRCPACGASARARALFCQQCGRSLNQDAQKSSVHAENSSPPRRRKSDQIMQPLPISPAKQVTQTPAGETLEPDKKHRITAIVEENVRPRVEKLRQASTNVLEEAAIDPSLRFLLIAIILIIISVVLILLSLIK